MTTIRITMTTNALARDTSRFRDMLPPHDQSDIDIRHNGGKIVVLTIADDRRAEIEQFLDSCHSVKAYQ